MLPSLQLVLLQHLINFNTSQSLPLYFSLGLYALFLFTETLLNTLIAFLKRKLGEEALIQHNLLLFDAIDALAGMRFYEDEKHQHEIDTLKDLTSWLPLQLIEFIHKTMLLGVTTIALSVLLSKLSVAVAIALLIAPWPYAILRYRFSYLEWEYDIQFAKDRRKLSYTTHLFLSSSSVDLLRNERTCLYP